LLGDYNRNNVVDAGDYVLWRKTMGASVPLFSGADGNGNGLVDPGDFAVWRTHFGQVFMPAAASGASAIESDLISANNQGTAANASAASRTAQKPAAGPAFKRDAQVPASGAALDLLLTLDPAYSPGDANHGLLASRDGDEATDAGSAFDIALDEALRAMAESVNAGLSDS
jgi:hypothetical protein